MLGKILLLAMSTMTLFAATATIDKTQITQGEAVTLTLSASGNDIEFPDINSIEGYDVQSQGRSSQTINNNGKVTHIVSRSYVLYLDKNTTIPPFTINVDGKKELTKPIQINVVTEKSIQKRKKLDVSLHVNNLTPYVGELIKATILFKSDERIELGSAEMEIVNFDNFWVKDKPIKKQYKKDGYNVQSLTYWLSALKKGKQTLGPVTIRAGIKEQGGNDPFGMFFQRLRPKILRSQKVTISAKPLPHEVTLIGQFDIRAFSDKKEVDQGKPINITVEVRGQGNIDDIEKFSINEDDTIVYDDKPKVQTTPSDEGIFGVFTQKFAIIASHDVTIKPFVLKYFDKKNGKIKTIQTNPIHVKVKENTRINTHEKSKIITPIKEKIVEKKVGVSYAWIVFAFFIGLIFGFVLPKIKTLFVQSEKLTLFSNDKKLLAQMLTYKGQNEHLDEQIELLESKIYDNKDINIDKKKIKKILKEIMST